MKNFWLESYKWGAIIGLVMSAAYLLEQTCMLGGRMELMFFVWLVASAGYIALLCFFTARRRAQYPRESGFPFGDAFAFLMVMIVVGAIVKGIAQYLYCNVGIGFPEYTDRSIAAIENTLARNGGVPASFEQIISESIRQLREAPTPTLFSTLWEVLRPNLIFGTILSLILAGILKREPKPFEN